MAPTDKAPTTAAAATADAHEIPDHEAEVYDRQIRLWGVDAQKRIQGTKILVLGMHGVNVEVCKNLVLAGMSVDVQDGEVADEKDLASNFFLAAAATATNNACIGKNRAEVCVDGVREMNPLTSVDAVAASSESLTEETIAKYNMVCAHNLGLLELARIDKLCRAKGIKLFATHAFGVDSVMFCDLGEHEYVVTKKVKTPAAGQKRKQGDAEGSAAAAGEPETGNVTEKISFASFEESMSAPWKDLRKRKRTQVPDAYFALAVEFRRESTGRPVEERAAIAKELLEAQSVDSTFVSVDELVHMLSLMDEGVDLCPANAVMGGIVGQEVLKAASRKDQPINNYFFFNGWESAGVIRQIPLSQ